MAGSHEIPRDDAAAEPSAAQRLVRRVVDRVSTRLHERYAEYRDGDVDSRRGPYRIVARLQRRFQCRRNGSEPCEEKPPFRKPQRWLVILGMTNRFWQYLSVAAFAVASGALDTGREGHVVRGAIEDLVRTLYSDGVAPDLHLPRASAPPSILWPSCLLLLGPCRSRLEPRANSPPWPYFWIPS